MRYCQEDDFLEIRDYVEKERDVFSVFNQSLEPIIKAKALKGDYDADIKELLGGALKEKTYRKYLQLFLRALAKRCANWSLEAGALDKVKESWKLLYYGLKVVKTEATFGKGEPEFDFKQFYADFEAKH